MSDFQGISFSSSGMRGQIPFSLNEKLIQDYGEALYSFFQPKSVLLGYDSRLSGHMIKDMLSSLLRWRKCDVWDGGVFPTPTLAIAMDYYQFDLGLMITASHNPEPWNGIKIFVKGGQLISCELWKNFEKFFKTYRHRKKEIRGGGAYFKLHDAFDIHYQKIFNIIDKDVIRRKKFKVVCDAGNGSGGQITVNFLKQLSCDVIPYHCEVEKKFSRFPEPIEKNLKETQEFVKGVDCDICFVQDSDADRLAIISPEGDYLSEEYTLPLVFLGLKQMGNKGAVVTNIMSSLLIEEMVKEDNDASVFRTDVGESAIVLEMKKRGAFLGGEGSGGIIIPSIHYVRDSLGAIASILYLLAASDNTISEYRNKLPRFYRKKINQEISSLHEKNLKKMIHSFVPHSAVYDSQNQRWSWWKPEGWIAFRKSQTEPLYRFFIESSSEKEVDYLAQSLRDVLIKLK